MPKESAVVCLTPGVEPSPSFPSFFFGSQHVASTFQCAQWSYAPANADERVASGELLDPCPSAVRGSRRRDVVP